MDAVNGPVTPVAEMNSAILGVKRNGTGLLEPISPVGRTRNGDGGGEQTSASRQQTYKHNVVHTRLLVYVELEVRDVDVA